LRDIKQAFVKHVVFDKIQAIECSPRANLVSDDMCQAMKEIKIKTLNFGFESGADRILKSLKVGSVDVESIANL
jgi:radical SAM superfamily enzyme YgiQ (UPF0313 family)